MRNWFWMTNSTLIKARRATGFCYSMEPSRQLYIWLWIYYIFALNGLGDWSNIQYEIIFFIGVKIITKSICFLYMTCRLSFFYSNVQKTYGPVKWSAFITLVYYQFQFLRVSREWVVSIRSLPDGTWRPAVVMKTGIEDAVTIQHISQSIYLRVSDNIFVCNIMLRKYRTHICIWKSFYN